MASLFYRRPILERRSIMSFFSWLRNRTSTRPARGRTQHRPAAARFRPRLEVLEDRCAPSTLTVTSAADSGAGTLRADIAAAKAGDTIVFAPSLDGKTITLSSGELNITKGVTIQGPGAGQLTVSGNNQSRVFEVNASQPVVLTGLTIINGSSNGGGGLLNDSGSTPGQTHQKQPRRGSAIRRFLRRPLFLGCRDAYNAARQ
jgi:hypothetical protein